MASRHSRLHGKVEGATGRCAVPGCRGLGEYKAPIQPANFDGPGEWRLLCLDHVREHNTKYNYFEGMSADEIAEAQGPLGGWERPSRRFAQAGADPAPAWADFADPLDAIAARFRRADRGPPQRFTPNERRALGTLGLGEDADLHKVRSSYSKLVRRFHPDRNGGDRSYEKKLGEVIDAWQTLKKAKAFA
ncbi:MAG TPA: J domain-containing protein [Sphingomicrobium sp.]|nr:J domain-containing protein [Sphingomicrobium sp.]